MLTAAIHTLVLYLFLIAGLRFLGRRQLGQMTALDLVVILFLGSAVETAMVGGNTSLPVGLVSAATLLIGNRALTEVLSRLPWARHVVLGSPTVLVHYGRFLDENLRSAGLTHSDVLQAIRERGEPDVECVKFAVLELDGSINIIPNDAESSRKPRPCPDGASAANTDPEQGQDDLELE